MRGNQHGTGDKRGDKSPALVDVNRQAKVGSSSSAKTKPIKPKKKGS